MSSPLTFFLPAPSMIVRRAVQTPCPFYRGKTFPENAKPVRAKRQNPGQNEKFLLMHSLFSENAGVFIVVVL